MFQNDTENLSQSQIEMLKAISNGETKLSSEDVKRRYSLGNPNTITKNKLALVRRDILDNDKGVQTFVDPLYRIWLRGVLTNNGGGLSALDIMKKGSKTLVFLPFSLYSANHSQQFSDIILVHLEDDMVFLAYRLVFCGIPETYIFIRGVGYDKAVQEDVRVA